MEDRIIHLEETIALQDRTIEQLSDALAAQQTEIDELTKQLRVLVQQVRGMSMEGDEGPSSDGPPPHYL